MTLQEWAKVTAAHLAPMQSMSRNINEGIVIRKKAIEAALLEAAEKITEEVIQILNDEPDLRMDELVSLKRKVFQIMERP